MPCHKNVLCLYHMLRRAAYKNNIRYFHFMLRWRIEPSGLVSGHRYLLRYPIPIAFAKSSFASITCRNVPNPPFFAIPVQSDFEYLPVSSQSKNAECAQLSSQIIYAFWIRCKWSKSCTTTTPAISTVYFRLAMHSLLRCSSVSCFNNSSNQFIISASKPACLLRFFKDMASFWLSHPSV